MALQSESIRGDNKKRETNLRNVFNSITLEQLTAEPDIPTRGMLVYADGTSWDPGSGEGIYFYNNAGSWVKL